MRLRGPLVSVGALGLAVLAVGVLAVWNSVSRARAINAIAVTTTIRVNGTDNTFAPPPSGATPTMTAGQAWALFSRHESNKAIPPGTKVRLGLLTSLIGPYCGVECDNSIVQNGMAYLAKNQLAYGYSWLAFPHRHLRRMNWIFLDASTGQMIIGVLAREPGAAGPGIRAPGVVTGIATPCAGPPPAARASVRVYAVRNGRTVPTRVTQTKGRHDRYRFVLPPGRYKISAPRSADKVAQAVLLHSGQTITVNFPNTCI
jgi:hypothetical protein